MLGAGVRRFATSAIRRVHYEEGPGKGGPTCAFQILKDPTAPVEDSNCEKNLPFSVENKWRLLAMMCVFFGSGFSAPFFIVRHQLLKK